MNRAFHGGILATLLLPALLAQPPHIAGTKAKPPVGTLAKTDNIKLLIYRLMAAGGVDTKGEFETTAHFEAKQAALLKANSNPLTFIKPAGFEEDFTYDADAQRMTVQMHPSMITLYEDAYEGNPAIPLRTEVTGRRQYIGKNAFGVSRLITSTKYEEYGVSLADESIPDFNVPLEFPLKPEVAKRLKDRLRVILTGTLMDAHVYRDTKVSGASLNVPYESVTRTFYVLFRLDEIKIVDVLTGGVIAKTNRHEESETPPDQTPNSEAQSTNPPPPERQGFADPPKSTPLTSHQPAIVDPKILHSSQAKYPALARAANVSGTVYFSLTVLPDGTAQNVYLDRGPPLLVQSAMEAAQHLRFIPGTIDGVPATLQRRVSFTFELPSGKVTVE